METVKGWAPVSSLRSRSPRNLVRSQKEAGDYEARKCREAIELEVGQV